MAATLSEGVEGLLYSSSDFSLVWLALSAVAWVYVHQRLSLSVPFYFLPAAAWKEHSRKVRLYRQGPHEKAKTEALPGAKSAGVSTHAEGALVGTSSAEDSPQELRKYYVTARANATAFVHATLICPMALAVLWVTFNKAWEELGGPPLPDKGPLGVLKWALWDWGETYAFYNFHSFLLDIIAYVMAGYFMWDLWECLKNRDVHSRAFVLHGILSLYAMVSYLLAPKGRMTGKQASAL
ncbi:uncharacterized protein LOC34621411 [Cyclospora cayetanensis]|uniref:Uncharacterized protein LOC34621411 n=1 Tax=Cyclospora cayetanensis TaxID=88456 RepID=A0A6P6RV45_9EIME|nr:uncharacterized protein LOC34621411 [Cyclospora cayetanensis]